MTTTKKVWPVSMLVKLAERVGYVRLDDLALYRLVWHDGVVELPEGAPKELTDEFFRHATREDREECGDKLLWMLNMLLDLEEKQNGTTEDKDFEGAEGHPSEDS